MSETPSSIRICPLRKLGCLKERCGMWDPQYHQCCVLSVAQEIATVGTEIKRLRHIVANK